MHRTKDLHDRQHYHCADLMPQSDTTQQLAEMNEQIAAIEEQLRELHDQLKRLERQIIDDAKVVFCTLTKNYTGDALSEQIFDAVIVDEISMALPPLVYLAASRASQRVVLAGDFLQLPPIVRSDAPVSNERLGTDVFELARVVCDGKPRRDCRVLRRLDGQHRMVTEIADVARYLVYDAAGGLRVWGYHAVNLTVHLLAGLTLFGLVRRTLCSARLRGRFAPASVWMALAASLLWVVHPLHTESVTYIYQRSEVVMGLCYLLTQYCVVRGAGSSQSSRWHVAAIIACALGMASKPIMVTAPPRRTILMAVATSR